MPEWLKYLFSTDYMPHEGCYLYSPGLIWLHVTSDMLIGLSYVAISAMMVYLVRQGRKAIPFRTVFLAFGLFIVACGGTHLMEVVTTWVPVYWISGIVKVVTAIASLATAAALPGVLPVGLNMVRSARVSEERRIDLERAHAELEELYDRLKESDDLKTRFFANVSHELRTPLALILGPTEKLLADEHRSEEERRHLEVVDRNARLLLKQVNDLLDVARLEAGKVDVDYVRTDLARLVRLGAAHFDALAAERDIAFRVDAPEVLPAEVDPEKLEHILLNLLSNAFKFTPARGIIRCSLEADGATRAVLTVSDSGPGVPADHRSRVFDRFHQADDGPGGRFGGTGLGLAIVRDFVLLHGGGVSVDDAPEGGALFAVSIPLTAPDGTPVRDEDPAAPSGFSTPSLPEAEARAAFPTQPLEGSNTDAESGPDAPEAFPAWSPDRPTVLVVEDNPDMRRFAEEVLTPDFAVQTAEDGARGLDMALAHPPDLILSDVMMPRMGGEDLVREARRHAALDGVPIVLLTARADDDLRVRMLRAGAQDYVMKPFVAEELRARVANLVAMKRARDVLQAELETQIHDLDLLAGEVAFRKREQQTLLQSLRSALEEAERASRVKTSFLRMVSHELRNPLNTLLLQLHLLQRAGAADLPPRQQDILQKMANSSTRLLYLIESLLEHARIESGQVITRVEPVDLARAAQSALDEWRPQAEQKGIALDLNTAPDLPPLRSDPRLVHLVLTNLVGNAVKFTDQGAVKVSVTLGRGAHHVSVHDTGPGIPPEHHAQVFEPFEHLEPVRHKHTPGVGLGLALVREMVHALGGSVTLESAEGEGSTFSVTLPPLPHPATGEETPWLT